MTTTTSGIYEDKTISVVHKDILLTHIFTRLDGPALACAACVSPALSTISTHQNLWLSICHSMWPSTIHPRMRHVINTFHDGHRSFFYDSFPLLVVPASSDSSPPPPVTLDPHLQSPSLLPGELISAVDIHYKKNLIFSKVQSTETLTDWFQCSPFRIDLIDPKDGIHTPINFTDKTCQDLEENLKLSWIMVDPIGRRAVNMSSVRPVSVQQHWLTEEIELKFVTIMEEGRSTGEFVESGIVVTCGRSSGGKVHVREVSLKIEDMDGRNLSGKDSIGVLQRGMVNGKRKKLGRKEEVRKRYEEYLKMKREKVERELRREQRLDTICTAAGVLICSAFSIIGVLLVGLLFLLSWVNYYYSYITRSVIRGKILIYLGHEGR